LAKGVLKEQIFLDLITPAARLLGQQWTDDEIDFVQVSQGLMQMHHVTRDLGYVNSDIPQVAGDVRRILLACAPGTQHILGLAIVADFFRNAGWQVISAVKAEWFDLIGLSVGLMEQLPTMPPLITKIKNLSRNPQSKVVLGGPALLTQDLQTSLWGSDGVSTDAAEAVKLANRLVNSA
jgi:methanogenic corrinoid protein MtbC1